MTVLNDKYTNIFGDTEVSGRSPDAEGDYYLVGDAQEDHNYWQGKIVDIISLLSNSPSEEFQILYGCVVSDGGSGTINISAGVAKGKDSNGKKRLIPIPALSGVSLPSGWNDNRQIWVIAKYDFKLTTDSRTHRAGTNYHYKLQDTYLGDINSENTTSTKDLFVDADPTGTAPILGSFKMNGTTYADQNVRTASFLVSNADKVDGYDAGNASGNIPVSNGTLNINLNADKVDGCDAETTLSPTSNTKIPTSKAVVDYCDRISEFKRGSNYYNRKDFNKVKSASARTTLVIPDYIETVINGDVFQNLTSFEIDIDTTTYWDDTSVTDWSTASNRAGKDFYIYACVPISGETFDIVLSANSTYPTGYTASNSRKIGGFHCLCVSAGTAVYGYINEGKDADYLENMFADGSTIANGDTNHWLKNFIQGDILPLSCWDLIHRPNENADVEGKVFDPKTNLWVDIYLPSWNSGLNKLLSVYGGTIADGASSPAFHWYRFSQVFTNQGQRLPRQDHFVACSLGSPQGVQISTGADPVTTGGKTATNGLRIISNIGVEDATGVLWQWGSESGTNTATTASDAYDANDKNVKGLEYSNITRPLFGGGWGDGVNCGSRSSFWNRVSLSLFSNFSGRGFAEPK